MEILITIQHIHTHMHKHTNALAIQLKSHTSHTSNDIPVAISNSPDLDPGFLGTMVDFRSRTRKVQGEPKTFYYARKQGNVKNRMGL